MLRRYVDHVVACEQIVHNPILLTLVSYVFQYVELSVLKFSNTILKDDRLYKQFLSRNLNASVHILSH